MGEAPGACARRPDSALGLPSCHSPAARAGPRCRPPLLGELAALRARTAPGETDDANP